MTAQLGVQAKKEGEARAMAVVTAQDSLLGRVRAARERLAALRARPMAEPPLPEWTLLPLRLVGMTKGELAPFSADQAGGQLTVAQIAQTRATEAEIAGLEDELIARPATNPRSVQTLVELALDRTRERALADGQTVFFDSPESRAERLLEQAVVGLAAMGPSRRAR